MVKTTDSSQNGGSQKDHTQVMKDTFEALRTFSSSTSMKAALGILDELNSVRAQLSEKEKELAQAKEDLKRKEEAHSTAITEMVKANQKELTKQDTLEERITALEGALKEKDKIIADKETEEKSLNEKITNLDTSYKNETANFQKANEEITELKKTLEDRDSLIKNLKEKGGELKKRYQEQKEWIDELKGKVSTLESSLNTSEGERQKLRELFQDFTVEEEEPMVDRFDELWVFATNEIWSLLKENLPQNILQNSKAWEHFNNEVVETLPEVQNVVLPKSNTDAAKAMRLIVLLSMLARKIDAQIFQPTYILSLEDDEDYDATLRDFSASKLAVLDEERDAYWRALLWSVRPEMQEKHFQERLEDVVRTVSETFNLIVPDSKKNQVTEIVKKIANKAAETWRPLQKAKARYETDFDPLAWGDKYWMPFEFPDSKPWEQSQTNGIYNDVLLTVFPRLSRIVSGNREGLTYVHQVKHSMPLCVAAAQEVMPEPPSPVVNKRLLNGTRGRRESVARNGIAQVNGNGHVNENGNGDFLGKANGV